MNYQIRPLKFHLEKYLAIHFLEKKWEKVKKFLENDLSHPPLNFKKIIL